MSEPKEKQKQPVITRLLVGYGKTFKLPSSPEKVRGYFEIEFSMPTGATLKEFESARKAGLTSIEAWLKEMVTVPVDEEIFLSLSWDESGGPKLGDFDVAYRDHNQPDPWQRAWNILKANNATLKDHYGPEGFSWFYWIYPEKYSDRIFRKRRQQEPKSQT